MFRLFLPFVISALLLSCETTASDPLSSSIALADEEESQAEPCGSSSTSSDAPKTQSGLNEETLRAMCKRKKGFKLGKGACPDAWNELQQALAALALPETKSGVVNSFHPSLHAGDYVPVWVYGMYEDKVLWALRLTPVPKPDKTSASIVNIPTKRAPDNPNEILFALGNAEAINLGGGDACHESVFTPGSLLWTLDHYHASVQNHCN